MEKGNETNRLVVITGAAGQVGQHAIAEYGARTDVSWVIATDILASMNQFRFPKRVHGSAGFESLQTDLRDRESMVKLRNAIQRRPERDVLILDIGALFSYSASQRDLHDANVVGQRNLIETVVLPLQNEEGQKIRVVFWSAAALYGGFDARDGVLPAREAYPVDPRSVYAETKRDAEELLLRYCWSDGLWVTIMRCGAIYGEGSTYGMGNAIMLMLLGLLEPIIVGSGKNHAATIHARDTVRIADFLSQCNEADGEVFNVRDDSEYLLEEITATQSLATGSRAFEHFRMPKDLFFNRIVKPVSEKSKAWGAKPIIDPGLANMMILDAWIDVTKLKKLFESRGVDFRSYLMYPDTLHGVERVVEWYKNNPKEWIHHV